LCCCLNSKGNADVIKPAVVKYLREKIKTPLAHYTQRVFIRAGTGSNLSFQ
jgi:hypothetical protein